MQIICSIPWCVIPECEETPSIGSLATEEAEVAGRLYCRMGAASADARIVAGFDVTDPLVTALVSSAIRDTLALVASDPASPLAAGLDLNIEQRFLG